MLTFAYFIGIDIGSVILAIALVTALFRSVAVLAVFAFYIVRHCNFLLSEY